MKFESGWNIIQMRVLKNINELEYSQKFNNCMINNNYDSEEDIVSVDKEYFNYL